MKQLLRSIAPSALYPLVFLLLGLSAWAQTTIMPMGDSGTVGVDYYTSTAGGYRDFLYQDLTASGISFTFIGSNTSNATPLLTAAGQTHHNGYGGWTIEDMDANLSGSAAPLYGGDGNAGGYWLTSGSAGGAVVKPTMVLLEAGANDFIKEGSTPLSTIEGYLQKLVTDIHNITPTTIIMVAGIYPFSLSEAADNSTIQSYNSWIQNTLVPSLSYTRYVDNFTPFFNNGVVNPLLLGADGIHPTRYGYPLWASNWVPAIRTLLGSNPTLYSVSVNNGTVNNVLTTGSYPAGSVVVLNSNAASGNQFGGWSPASTALQNNYYPITNYTVPAYNSTITANYVSTGGPTIPSGTYEVINNSLSQFQFIFGYAIGAASAANGASAQAQTYTGASTQQWVVTNLPSINGTTGVIEMSLPNTNLAIGVVGASGSAGANLDVATYTGSLSQQWAVNQSVGPGVTVLVNLNSGLAITYGYNPQLNQNSDAYGVAANAWSFYPIASGSTPSNLTATAGNAQVVLNWTAGSGASSYNVYRGTSSGGESATPFATGITATSYTNSGLTNGTTYYYEVAAVSSSGTTGYSNEASATPAVPSAPPAPTGLTATAGISQVSLTWNASSGATSYNVYRGTSSGDESATPLASGASTSYTDTAVTDGIAYYYKITAVNTTGTSGYSSEANATPTAPAAPTGLTATAGNAQIGLGWASSTGATSYIIYRGTSSGGESSTPIGTATTTTYSDTGLTNGTTYYYKVAAANTSGTSAYSNEAIATPSSSGGSGVSSVVSVVYGSSSAITVGVSAGVVPETVWNNDPASVPYFADGSTSLSNLTDSNGNHSGISETLTTYAGYHTGAAVTGFPSAGNNAIYSYGPYTVGPSEGGVLTLAGLNSALTYDLYIYTNDPNGAAGTLVGVTNSLNSQSYYLTTITNASINSFVLGSATTSGAAAAGDYFKITALTGATTFTATLGSSGAEFDAFQLVVHTAGGGAPSAPSGLAATAGNEQVALRWSASTGATSYNVYRGTSAGGESAAPIMTGITATSCTNTGLTNGTAYYYTVAAVNTSGTSGYSNEAGATPAISYSQWANTYFASDPANAGEAATPEDDGVTNLLKYLCDINPTVPMNASAWDALPKAGTTTLNGSSYLTLTCRESTSETGLTINVQTASDLASWQTVTPSSILIIGTDPATGDPLVQYQVQISPQGASKEFIRLNVTGP